MAQPIFSGQQGILRPTATTQVTSPGTTQTQASSAIQSQAPVRNPNHSCIICQQPIGLFGFECTLCPIGFHQTCLNDGYRPPQGYQHCPVCIIGRIDPGQGRTLHHRNNRNIAASYHGRLLQAQTYSTNRVEWDAWFELDLTLQPYADQSILVFMGAANGQTLVRYPCYHSLDRKDWGRSIVEKMDALEAQVRDLEAENSELKKKLGE